MITLKEIEKIKSFFAVWIAIYPLVILMQALISRFLEQLPLFLKTLISTGILSAVMVFWAVPLVKVFIERFLKLKIWSEIWEN